jgi:hypothetical protein
VVSTVVPVAESPADRGGHGARRAAVADPWGAAIWLVVVVAALWWGTARVADAGVALRAAPLYGRWSWHPGLGLLPAVLVAGVAVAAGPAVAVRCPARRLPLVAGAAAVVWTVALAASDGWDQLSAPPASEHEYLPAVAGIGAEPADLGAFVDRYVERLPEQPIHVQGHPPGPVVLAWGLDRLGLGGAGWLAAAALGGWGVAVASALVAAGGRTARRAAPALVLLPAAVWAGTSLDALFAGVSGAAIAAAVVAARRGSTGWAVAAGIGVGTALLCTYGAPLVLLIGVAGAAAARPARPLPLLAAAVAGAAVPLAGAAAAGFWWPDGLAATHDAYWAGVASSRPAAYLTLLGNPAALALATGPAVAAGLWATARRPTTVDLLTTDRPGTRPTTASHVTADLLTTARPGTRPTTASQVTADLLTTARPDTDPTTTGPAAVDQLTADRPGTVPTTAGPTTTHPTTAGRWSWLGAPAVVLPLAALAAVAAADLSQMSRGEVERIWLPFVPWLALAAPGDRRPWLAVQAGVALVVQASLVSPW